MPSPEDGDDDIYNNHTRFCFTKHYVKNTFKFIIIHYYFFNPYKKKPLLGKDNNILHFTDEKIEV